MDKYLEVNRAIWNASTPIHVASAFYDVPGFKAGRCTVFEVERAEVGDVSGKSLLHLQCHFGMDTLSWARLGARVVGVDFSDVAIAQAQALAAETGIDARFVCSDVYALRERVHEQFDVVFTSQGVLCWLPDVMEWGRIAAHFLRPGGVFYIHEFHPIGLFYQPPGVVAVLDGETYARRGEPIRSEQRGTYADLDADICMPEYEWPYTLGDVVTALASAGLRIEFLHEFDHCAYPAQPGFVRRADGFWYCPHNSSGLPLMFSIRATKE
ncbi:MAG: methyltransferase domain-containing protein [Candidatus Hydrogenedentes bacterium]|nr:methyltransferase domain-containing protein [Candidatus Hydrogenedentota bacterium]